MSGHTEEENLYAPPQAAVAAETAGSVATLTRQEKLIGWISAIHYTMACVGVVAYVFYTPATPAILALAAISLFGMIGAIAWLRMRRWALYLLPLTYVPQIIRIVSEHFVLNMEMGISVYLKLMFGQSMIGLNVFAILMIVWASRFATGRLWRHRQNRGRESPEQSPSVP